MTLDPKKLESLTYDDFRRLALEEGLSAHERIGFPDEYREGRESQILEDIREKAINLDAANGLVVDVGCGCGTFVQHLAEHCRERSHDLVLIDSAEVLSRIPDSVQGRKSAGRFPQETARIEKELNGRADVVLAYSLFHYVVLDSNPFDFLDRALALLTPGGELLIGDVPNVSMRRRFFASESGRRFHRQFTGTESEPEVAFNRLEIQRIDDAVIVGMLLRARTAGFHAWVLPQRAFLPMANRREDILFRRP